MKRFILLSLMFLISLNLKAEIDTIPNTEDSLTFATIDLSDLYKYARDGYYLKKIDSINGEYIGTLELEVRELNGKKKDLEIIVRLDKELIKELVEKNLNLEVKGSQCRSKIAELELIIKRLRREKRETILSGIAVTIVFLVAKFVK
jgi:hypothetical protein